MPRLLAKLPESSRHRGAASRAGTVVSVIVHATLITLAVAATGMGKAPPGAPKPVDTGVIWISRTTEDPPPPPAHGGTTPRGAGESPGPALPRPQRDWLPGPIIVDVATGPIGGPAIAERFDGSRAAVGGGGDGTRAGEDNGVGAPFDANVVDVAVRLRPGSPAPRYPEELRGARLEGRVVARFVVDTTGRVEPASVRIVSSTHPLFTSAVQATLPALRFTPARARGTRVRQLVELPFEFAMER